MYEPTLADCVWNRAALESGGSSPLPGDFALASLLRAHGLAMNGGVFHLIELLDAEELAIAKDGYRFFGLVEVADLLTKAEVVFEAGLSDDDEDRFDSAYLRIARDSILGERFEARFRSNPEDFSPLS